MPPAKNRLIRQGKAKDVLSGPSPDSLVMHFRDDATAHNNQKHDVFQGKGVINNRISAHLFQLIETIGIPTHFIKNLNMRQQLVRKADVLPLEIIVRNYVAGSLAQRVNSPDGEKLPRPVVEFCLKNDALNDPVVGEDLIDAMQWASQHEIDDAFSIALRINDFLSGYFRSANLILVDFKIELGRIHRDDDYPQIILVDEISPDTCRLHDADTHKSLDKDLFRKDSGNLIDAYQTVAQRLGLLKT